MVMPQHQRKGKQQKKSDPEGLASNFSKNPREQNTHTHAQKSSAKHPNLHESVRKNPS